MRKRKYTRELLEKVISETHSFAGALRMLGVRVTGGGQGLIKQRTIEYRIDYSHFTGQASSTGVNHKGGPEKKKWQEVLILRNKNLEYGREKSFRLRRALIEMGRPYQCEGDDCKVKNIWNGKEIILHVDHENGNYFDCRPENLKFLCPNCHSQTKGYSNSKGYTTLTSTAKAGRKYRERKKLAQVGKLVDPLL
jgi:hypothetical protein